MKFSFLLLASLISFSTYAKDVKDFNKVLIDGVQRDIDTDNDQALKTKQMRGPASVIEDEYSSVLKEENKFEKKNLRQMGSEKW